jgi:hypothetical protein
LNEAGVELKLVAQRATEAYLLQVRAWNVAGEPPFFKFEQGLLDHATRQKHVIKIGDLQPTIFWVGLIKWNRVIRGIKWQSFIWLEYG